MFGFIVIFQLKLIFWFVCHFKYGIRREENKIVYNHPNPFKGT